MLGLLNPYLPDPFINERWNARPIRNRSSWVSLLKKTNRTKADH
jgi:hypothetical protein